MPNTYVALDTKTISTTVASVTFTSIPSGYTDLILVADATTAVANGSITLQFNGDTSTNYSYTALYGTGSAAGSLRASNAAIIGFLGYAAQVPVGTRAMGIAHIQNYSNTTTNKTVLIRNTPSVSATVEAAVGLWRSTAAINSITVLPISGASIGANSTFSLYGIAAAPIPTAKATGGTIYFGADGYTYHKFTSSGTFTPLSSLTTDMLVIAGGGSGYCGGGGAGGVIGFTNQSLSATGYTVTVGAGGSGGVNSSSAGNNSVFSGLTAAVGGGRGGPNDISNSTYSAGGSGGGGGGSGSITTVGGAATSGQGFPGGTNGGFTGSPFGGGGGGGAGEAGRNATASNVPGRGGNGTNAYSAWANATLSGVSGYFAGGGGSAGTDGSGANGAGGLGGGAAATAGANNPGAVANTGGGGGGVNSGTYSTGNGGSGIVIVRYASF